MLARSDFASAVKHALRHLTRPDMLVRNPLLRTDVMEQRTTGAPTAQDLCRMLVETTELLFANARDQKLYRVLDVAYLNPVPKQEAAADKLSMAFSTYRRYLATGINRITNWLWEQEQAAHQRGPAAEYAAAFPGAEKAGARTTGPLSILVLPLLNLPHDPAVRYLAAGLVNNLLTDICRALPCSVVIPPSRVAIRQVGQELRIHYVAKGRERMGQETGRSPRPGGGRAGKRTSVIRAIRTESQ